MVLRKKEFPLILNLYKIWDQAPYNGMTDLIFFKNQFFCVFCESNPYSLQKEGHIRLISSDDGLKWISRAYLSEKEMDLKDPQLSITPDEKLMLLIKGTIFDEKREYLYNQSYVAFSTDGTHWSPFQAVLTPQECLWKLTWNQKKAFGVAYHSCPSSLEQRNSVNIYGTEDGVNYSSITHLDIPGYPTEGVLGFLTHGQMVGLFRRDQKGNNYAWVGVSYFPFLSWRWRVAQYPIEAPNFIVQSDNQMWAAGRILSITPYGIVEKTALMEFDFDVLEPVLILPSGGDTGGVGLVYKDDFLWMSYHSSHEGRASIYLAQIQLPF